MAHTEAFHFPAGISGFWGRKDKPPPQFEPTLFEQKCAETAQIGYQLLSFVAAKKKKQSYHLALVEEDSGEKRFVVICNKYYPIVAFALPSEPLKPALLSEFKPPQTYVSNAGLFTHFNTSPFCVIPTEVLQLEVDADNPETAAVMHQLYDTEFAEFAFWEPRCMGDIAFNNWG